MLKVDKNGIIYRPNGTVMGAPKKSGKIYRSANQTGTLNPETGEVFDKKGEKLGEVDMSKINIEFILPKNTPKSLKNSTKTKKIKTSESPKNEQSEKQEIKKKITEIRQEWVPGKDSYLIVTGRLGRIAWPQKYETEKSEVFVNLNKIRGWNYSNWIQLSAREDLDNATLIKYAKYIDWYTFKAFHPDHVYTEELNKYIAK